MKVGIIDVGGGLRGSFGAGVLDYCLDKDIHIHYGIGVSAGAANLVSYMAKQRGRNYVFYTDYFERWQYMGLKNFIHTGSYIGLDYIYSNLSNHDGDYPLDWQKLYEGDNELLVVATNALTGLPHYFNKDDMSQDNYDPIKASCCVPAVNKPYKVNGIPYYDGGISDPIPYKKALEQGCDKIIVILTRPIDFRRTPKKDKTTSHLLKKHYPNASIAMMNRSEVYNRSVDECERLEAAGVICLIASDSIGKMKTLTKDKETIIELYNKGYKAGAKIEQFLKEIKQ